MLDFDVNINDQAGSVAHTSRENLTTMKRFGEDEGVAPRKGALMSDAVIVSACRSAEGQLTTWSFNAVG
jgi:hypothetical protein